MRDLLRRLRFFVSELRRRKIFRAAAVYATVAFVVLQAAAVIFPALHLPDWTLTFLVVVVILGFPLVLTLEWVFEITSEGIRPESEALDEPEGIGGAPPSSGGFRPGTDRSADDHGAVDQEGERETGRLWRRPVVIAPAALVLVLAVASAWGLRPGPTQPDPVPAPTAVAVLPFSVRGGEEARFLEEGLVSLLGTALDGAGGLRTVDARALLGVLAQEGGAVRDPSHGRRLTTRLGAGLFVLGDVVQVGNRLQIDAAVYGVDGDGEPLHRAAVTGPADAVFELVDDLAARLVAGIGDPSADRLVAIAAITTASLSAFRAYLEGEEHMRAGRFERAAEAYERAIDGDSTYSLAHYRLALAREWAPLPGTDASAREAVRHAGRLSPRDRALLEAYEAWKEGDAIEAERRYRAILARYPDDVEAWHQLGEILFHFAPVLGVPVQDSENAWRQVLFYEPDNRFALLHLARILAPDRRVAALDSVLAPFGSEEVWQDRRLLEIELYRVLAAGDGGAVRSLMQEMARWEDLAIWRQMGWVLLFTADPAPLRTAFSDLMQEHRNPWIRADLYWHMALLHLAGGQAEAAGNALTRAAAAEAAVPPEDRRWAFEAVTRWFAATLPFPYAASTLDRLRRSSASVPTEPPAGSGNPGFENALGLGAEIRVEPLRLYTVGLLSLALDDRAPAAQAAEELVRLAPAEETNPHVRDLDRGLRATMAWHDGRAAEALSILEGLEVRGTQGDLAAIPFMSRAVERFLRADVLAALGRKEEALSWLASVGRGSVSEVAFLGPVHLRRAEILDALGRADEAAENYEAFVELWRDADPEFQPLVDAARERLQQLAQGAAP